MTAPFDPMIFDSQIFDTGIQKRTNRRPDGWGDKSKRDNCCNKPRRR